MVSLSTPKRFFYTERKQYEIELVARPALHFQNEHIAVGKPPGQGKICKLCSATAPDIMTLRRHLTAAHSIDLDNPLACLVEAEATPSPKR